MYHLHGIELRHLRYFLAVYDELNFRRAAELLHMAQPPLSRAIQALERELGLSLLTRTSRGVEPTEDGRAFAQSARKAVATFDYAVAEARRRGQGDATLRIGCSPMTSTRALQRFLDALKARDSTVEAELTHLLSLEQLRLLRAGELDLGIVVESDDYGEVESEPLFRGEPLMAFLPSDHRLASESVLRAEDLRNETLLVNPEANPAVYAKFLADLTRVGYRFKRLRTAQIAERRDMLLTVAGGLGISFGPVSLEGIDESVSVVMRPIEPELSMPNMRLVWLKDSPGPRLDGLREDLREVARELFQEPVLA
jgi:DNA-binding transcriptional LysR family regulator